MLVIGRDTLLTCWDRLGHKLGHTGDTCWDILGHMQVTRRDTRWVTGTHELRLCGTIPVKSCGLSHLGGAGIARGLSISPAQGNVGIEGLGLAKL